MKRLNLPWAQVQPGDLLYRDPTQKPDVSLEITRVGYIPVRDEDSEDKELNQAWWIYSTVNDPRAYEVPEKQVARLQTTVLRREGEELSLSWAQIDANYSAQASAR